MRVRVSERLRAFMEGKSTAPAARRAPEARCCGARAFLWHVVLPALGVALAARVVFGMGAAFSAWRRGESLALPRSLAASWQAPPVAGPSRAPLAAPHPHPPQPLQQPLPRAAAASTAAGAPAPAPALAALAFGEGYAEALRAEAAGFEGALAALAEERAYAEAQRQGLDLYAPTIPWGEPSAAQAAAAASAAAGASALWGQPCGFASAEEAGKKGYSCAYRSAPGERAQCCCSRSDVAPAAAEAPPAHPPRRRPLAPSRRSFVCLPSLLIAGAQKSGSTALTGYLLTHPNFAASVRKEVHYFDRYHERGLEWYLTYMPPTDEGGTAAQVTGEASPAYMLGTATAARMAAALPQGRVAVLLREPAARAYSEWNMKLRRVEGQVRVGSSETLERSIFPPLHACLAAAWAPLAPLLAHAAAMVSGSDFASAVAAEAAAWGSGAGEAAEEPLFALLLDPLRDAAVTGAVARAWAAVLGEREAGAGAGSGSSSSAAATTSASARLTIQSTESWTVLVNGLSALAAGREAGGSSGSGAARRRSAPAPPAQPGSAAAAASEAALGLVAEFLSAHWALHAHNASERCIRERVLPVSNGLGSIYRALPKAAETLGTCLVGRVSPPSAALVGAWALGKGAEAAPALSNLWGLRGGGSGADSAAAAAAAADAQALPAAAQQSGTRRRAAALQQQLASREEAAPAFWLLGAAPHASEALLRVLGYALERGERAASRGGAEAEGGAQQQQQEVEEEEEEKARQARRRGGGGVRGRSLLQGAAPPLSPSAALQQLIATAGRAVNAALVSCFSTLESTYTGTDAKLPIRYEEIEAFEAVVDREIEELAKCSAAGLSEGELWEHLGAPSLRAGAAGNGSASAVTASSSSSDYSLVLDGRESCWVGGATSNIAGDFLYRSMYLQQLARLHKAFGKVRGRC